jgi:hypothetical protein
VAGVDALGVAVRVESGAQVRAVDRRGGLLEDAREVYAVGGAELGVFDGQREMLKPQWQ